MNEIYLTVHSLTNAQKMKKILTRSGINAKIVRPELSLSEKGCAYAVLISEKVFAETIEILEMYRIMPVRAFVKNEYGEAREINL